jgi:hypothetical protein
MKIIELLKTGNARLEYGRKWLVYEAGYWKVMYRPPYAKNTRELCAVEMEEFAVKTLLEQ